MATIWKDDEILAHQSKALEQGKERGKSLWVQEEKDGAGGIFTKPPLQGEITTEVAVIGAGLAGVLIAYLLQEQGISVVVLDWGEAGRGITKNTTAKITSQHGLIYRKLMMYKGEERAQEYGRANQKAISKYEEIIEKLKIDCDFEHLPNYIYTLDNETRLCEEVEAAKKLGLPASLTKDTALPFAVKAAVRFEKQAQFHPLKFLDAVAKQLTIYENTRIHEVRSEGIIITEQGRVKAKSIVVATHYPFINIPGYYFFRMHQEREYVAALENGSGQPMTKLKGMYLDADPQGFSFRNHQNLLLLGGGSHRAGDYMTPNSYAKIEGAARRWYPETRIRYTWSNQDCITPDSVPYIGRYSVNLKNIYVATGFNKWGMTSSMVSAFIIRDMIIGAENEDQKVFDPRRMIVSGSKVFLKDAAIITGSLLSEHLKITRNKIKGIEPGRAGTVEKDGQKIGVYRDMSDKYYFVTTKCPHLGCSLVWNQNELTWDCPCHGSRFDYHGKLINNPAVRDTFDACQRKKK